MEVERFTKVMHIVSTVEGELREDLHPLDALAVTFPAGTVTGAPKRRAMELIAEHEPTARGPYAGAVGYLTFAGDLDFCITIRTAVVADGRASRADGRRRRRRLRPARPSCRRPRRRRRRCFPRSRRATVRSTRAEEVEGPVILVVDHYDSFTYNLVQLVESLGRATEVVKSDAEPAEALVGREPDAVILSPGPGRPEDAGVFTSLLDAAARRDPRPRRVPRPSGARRRVRRARRPRRRPCTARRRSCTTRARASSRASPIRSRPAAITRSSCCARRCPTELELTAWTEDGLVMAHAAPRRCRGTACSSTRESSSRPEGPRIVENFLALVGR